MLGMLRKIWHTALSRHKHILGLTRLMTSVDSLTEPSTSRTTSGAKTACFQAQFIVGCRLDVS